MYLKPFKGSYGGMTKSSKNLSKTSVTNYNSVTKIKAKRSSLESNNSQQSPTRENIYSTFENYEQKRCMKVNRQNWLMLNRHLRPNATKGKLVQNLILKNLQTFAYQDAKKNIQSLTTLPSSIRPNQSIETRKTPMESLDEKKARNINNFIQMNLLRNSNYKSQKPLKSAHSIPFLGKTHTNGFK